MKRLILVGLTLGLSSVAHADSITTSKAAELAVHRIERLVTLKKIDVNFINRFYSISSAKLPQGQPTDPAYKASGFQVPGPDGKSYQVDILEDAAGKALSNTVINGSDPAVIPTWPDKDPVSLAENSLHFILDNAATKPELAPFYTGFTNLVLSQVKDAQGQLLSRATIRTADSDLILDVFLKTDGTFASSSIHKP